MTEFVRTLMDDGGRNPRGLQNRVRALEFRGPERLAGTGAARVLYMCGAPDICVVPLTRPVNGPCGVRTNHGEDLHPGSARGSSRTATPAINRDTRRHAVALSEFGHS